MILKLLALAFRQHFLERLKTPVLLIPMVGVWAIAAIPNPLGTSYLFWHADNFYYWQTCVSLGFLSATWIWISFLTDTGQPWLVNGSPVRIKPLTRFHWPGLPSYGPSHVFTYLSVSVFAVAIVYGLAHAWHTVKVDLPARSDSIGRSFLVTSGLVFLSSLVGLALLKLVSLCTDARVAKVCSRRVRADLQVIADRNKESGYASSQGSAEAFDEHQAFAWLHETAALSAVGGAAFLFGIALLSWFNWAWGGASVHLCLLVALLLHVIGFALYRLRTGGAWFGLIFFGVLIAVFSYWFNPKYPIRNLGPMNGRIALQAALNESITELGKPSAGTPLDANPNENQSTNEKERPLVVVCVSGGGIRAQIWALATLCALDHALPGFTRDCHLVTGASGGMVGATHYVASLQSANVANNRAFSDAEYLQLVHDASRDALTATFRTFVLNDVLGAVPRKLVRLIGGRITDRGQVLEDEWIRLTENGGQSVFSKTLGSLHDTEKSLLLANKGWRPVLLYAPTIAEDGRRLIICNQRIDNLVSNRAATVAPPSNNILSVDSIHLQDIDAAANDHVTLATAARLNANFPFVVASPQLAPTGNARSDDSPLHVMDGGYYDNYGINLAARWLDHHADKIKERYSGVLLVQIASDHRNRRTVGGQASNFPEIGYIGTGFQKTTFLTDFQIAQLDAKFNDLVRSEAAAGSQNPFFQFCSLEFDGPVSLSWSLTPSELFALLIPYAQMDKSPFALEYFPQQLNDDLSTLKADLESGQAIFCSRYPGIVDGKDPKDRSGSRELQDTVKRIGQQVDQLRLWWHAKSIAITE